MTCTFFSSRMTWLRPSRVMLSASRTSVPTFCCAIAVAAMSTENMKMERNKSALRENEFIFLVQKLNSIGHGAMKFIHQFFKEERFKMRNKNRNVFIIDLIDLFEQLFRCEMSRCAG